MPQPEVFLVLYIVNQALLYMYGSQRDRAEMEKAMATEMNMEKDMEAAMETEKQNKMETEHNTEKEMERTTEMETEMGMKMETETGMETESEKNMELEKETEMENTVKQKQKQKWKWNSRVKWKQKQTKTIKHECKWTGMGTERGRDTACQMRILYGEVIIFNNVKRPIKWDPSLSTFALPKESYRLQASQNIYYKSMVFECTAWPSALNFCKQSLIILMLIAINVCASNTCVKSHFCRLCFGPC